jgi:hypothetical protein
MKCEPMVYIMGIHLVMGARLAKIRVGGGHLGRIRTILLPMQPTIPPTLILSPLFNSVERGTPPGSYLGPLPFCGIVLDV